MKYLIIVSLFLNVYSVNSQNESLDLPQLESVYKFNTLDFLVASTLNSNSYIPISFNMNFLKKNDYFSIYNFDTKLNDTYAINNNSAYFLNSKKIIENDFRTYKIDSFNPYGASDAKGAIIFGALGFVLDKLQD